MYNIHMGVPGMEALWKGLTRRYDRNELSRSEKQLFRKLTKALGYLSKNPRHPSLCTHDIDALSRRYGFRVWQSYLENDKPAAGRLYWTYGPNRGDITILALEPHPEDKKRGGYDRVKLSEMPPFG